MTAKVTSSASDSLGAIPTAGRQGARCGEVFSRSSVVTYSAVARVSRAASTGPPRLDVGFATPILDALLHLRIWLLGGRKLRPLGIGHLGVSRGRHGPVVGTWPLVFNGWPFWSTPGFWGTAPVRLPKAVLDSPGSCWLTGRWYWTITRASSEAAESVAAAALALSPCACVRSFCCRSLVVAAPAF